ncbi:MAG: hypothetical protein SOI38_02615 [Eggerthellaceae bacterium]
MHPRCECEGRRGDCWRCGGDVCWYGNDFDDVRFSSPAEAVSYLKQWVSARISFIDGAVADW